MTDNGDSLKYVKGILLPSVAMAAVALSLPVACDSDDEAVEPVDAVSDTMPTEITEKQDAIGDLPEVERPFPELDPAACLPSDPLDLAGIDLGYQVLSNGLFLEDRNWYLLTVFLEAVGVQALLDGDPAVKAVSLDRDQEFRQAAAGCKGETACLSKAIRWNADELEPLAGELVRVLVDTPGPVKPVTDQLRPSGMFHLLHALTDAEMLRAAFIDTMETLNKALDKYALSLESGVLDSLVKDISTANQEQMYFFEPLVRTVTGAMIAQGRDEAARYEPLSEGENKAAFKRIPDIAWEDWRFPVILVPGWGPTDLASPLSDNGREHCDLAAARWKAGLAPFMVVTGGHVHPDGTPYCEAIEMKKYLMAAHGVPKGAIIVEPYARHTTTNMRNTARLMIRYGIPIDRPSLISTDVLQAIYISALDDRCMDELGYVPYRNVVWLAEGDDCFLPAPASLHADPRDPLDP